MRKNPAALNRAAGFLYEESKFGFIGKCDPCTFLSLSREKYQKSAT